MAACRTFASFSCVLPFGFIRRHARGCICALPRRPQAGGCTVCADTLPRGQPSDKSWHRDLLRQVSSRRIHPATLPGSERVCRPHTGQGTDATSPNQTQLFRQLDVGRFLDPKKSVKLAQVEVNDDGWREKFKEDGLEVAWHSHRCSMLKIRGTNTSTLSRAV